jgi:hypothetical protein
LSRRKSKGRTMHKKESRAMIVQVSSLLKNGMKRGIRAQTSQWSCVSIPKNGFLSYRNRYNRSRCWIRSTRSARNLVRPIEAQCSSEMSSLRAKRSKIARASRNSWSRVCMSSSPKVVSSAGPSSWPKGLSRCSDTSPLSNRFRTRSLLSKNRSRTYALAFRERSRTPCE